MNSYSEQHLYQEGAMLLIDKPLEWTSFDVIKKLRNVLGIKKMGHAGTLDPLATGLVIVCTGKMTKQLARFEAMEKEYTGTLVIGATTPSHDLETEVEQQKDFSHLQSADLERIRSQFVGDLNQIPPIHSAVKVGGKRSYELARKGQKPELKPKPVTIYRFDFTAVRLPEIDFRINCSKGTYIRSLVRDYGSELGVGAYLKRLRRTRIGSYRIGEGPSSTNFWENLQPVSI